MIVSDQRMPGINGVEFLEKAKNIFLMQFVTLTGYSDAEISILKTIENDNR